MLLEAGADPGLANSIGRTAAELASFTGQHHCVSLINNFLPLDDILTAAGVTGSSSNISLSTAPAWKGGLQKGSTPRP